LCKLYSWFIFLFWMLFLLFLCIFFIFLGFFTCLNILNQFCYSTNFSFGDSINLIKTNQSRFFVRSYSIITSNVINFPNQIISRTIFRRINLNNLIFTMLSQYTHECSFSTPRRTSQQYQFLRIIKNILEIIILSSTFKFIQTWIVIFIKNWWCLLCSNKWFVKNNRIPWFQPSQHIPINFIIS
jgi:hypothetical protein